MLCSGDSMLNKITEKYKESEFYEYYSKDEHVSIFLSQYSLNLGNAYGYGKVENDSAISIAKYLTGVK